MKKLKSFARMKTGELAAATSQYDRPFVALRESKPLSATMRKMHRLAVARGHPKVPPAPPSRDILRFGTDPETNF